MLERNRPVRVDRNEHHNLPSIWYPYILHSQHNAQKTPSHHASFCNVQQPRLLGRPVACRSFYGILTIRATAQNFFRIAVLLPDRAPCRSSTSYLSIIVPLLVAVRSLSALDPVLSCHGSLWSPSLLDSLQLRLLKCQFLRWCLAADTDEQACAVELPCEL